MKDRCINCGHVIIKTNKKMDEKLRTKPWIHLKHDIDGNCEITWCKCRSAVPKGDNTKSEVNKIKNKDNKINPNKKGVK